MKVDFQNFKKTVESNYPLLKTVSAKSLSFVDHNVINADGLQLPFSVNALGQLHSALGIDLGKKSGIKSIEDSETRLSVKNLLLKSNSIDKKGNTKAVTLIASAKEPIIIGVSTKPLVTAETYFKTFENVMNFDNFDIKQTWMDRMGFPHISVATNRNVNFMGSEMEDFNTGLSLGVKMDSGLDMMTYLFRLICSNGATIRDFENNINFNSDDFYNALAISRGSDYVSPRLPQFIERAAKTKASLAEVKEAATLILNHTKNGLNYSELEQWNQYEKMNEKYKSIYGLRSINSKQSENILTDASVWDIVNGITDYASHEYGYIVDRAMLQTAAFKFLMKNKLHAEEVLPTSLQLN